MPKTNTVATATNLTALQRSAKSAATRFKLGNKGGPGRPKLEQSTRESEKEYLRNILTSVEYRENFKARLLTGKLAPNLESMAWDRGFGKVKDSDGLDGELVISWRVPARLEPALEAVALPAAPEPEPDDVVVAWRRHGSA